MRYKFILKVGEDEMVFNRWSEELNFDVEKEGDYVFYRKKLSGKLTFQKQFYWAVMNSKFEQEFILKIEEYDLNGDKIDEWKGLFYKTDCDIDEEEKSIQVQPEADDIYRKVVEGLDREFDLIKLRPLSTKVKFKKQPLIQIYLKGANLIGNYLGGNYWESEVSSPVFDEDLLVDDYKFAKAYDKVIVPGTLPYSGLYDGHTRVSDDDNYVIVQDSLIPSFWRIRDRNTSVNVAFSGSISQEGLFGIPQHSHTERVFGIGEFGVKVFRVEAYIRILTDVENITGYQSFDLPETDIVDELGYNKVIPLDIGNIDLSGDGQDESNKFGRFSSDAQFNKNQYFTPFQSPNGATVPVLRSTWTQFSIWFHYDSVIRELQESGASERERVDTYKISNVLALLLKEIDENVNHLENAVYSQFLYSSINPISGINEGKLAISPTTNITVGGYDQPASRAIITLGEILRMLRDVYNCDWLIRENGDFVVEHRKYFENGGSYIEKIIGYDLTSLIESRTEKLWGFGQKKYKWEKFQMPERITWKWQSKMSDIFDGFPIIINSAYVQKGKIDERTISKFVSDLDFVQAHVGEVSKEGFILLGIQGGNSMDYIPFFDVNQGGEIRKVQNGQLSFIYLHDKFWRHGLPGKNITLNEEEVEAISQSRRKIQEIKFPASDVVNPIQLIKTVLGEGEVSKLSINLADESVKATIKHDTED